jgi:branched-chain amino acid transport system substrate-binding protein
VKKFLAILLALALAVSLVLAGCGGAPAQQEEEEEEEEPAPSWIEVGHVSSTEGMYAGFGQGNIFGIEAAIEDINALGGVYVAEYDTEIPLRLHTLESASDEGAMAGLAETLIDTDNVVALVGGILPPTMDDAMAAVAEEEQVPFIIHSGPYEPWMDLRPAAATYTFTETFRIATPLDPPQDGYLIRDIGFDFHEALGVDETDLVVGVFASEDGDGVAWFQLMGEMLDAAGYTTSTWADGKGLFPMDAIDYSDIFNTWIADGVNAIWGNCPPPHFITMYNQAYAAGFRPEVVFNARAGLFWLDMDGGLGELSVGMGLESWWHNAYDPVLCPGIGGTTPQSLHDRWVAETGQPLNPAVGWGYANIQVLADAIERAGTLDGPDIKAALQATDLPTVAYNIKFDPADNNSPCPLYYFQWFWDDDLETVVPEVVVSHHAFIPQTETAFLITYP